MAILMTTPIKHLYYFAFRTKIKLYYIKQTYN